MKIDAKEKDLLKSVERGDQTLISSLLHKYAAGYLKEV